MTDEVFQRLEAYIVAVMGDGERPEWKAWWRHNEKAFRGELSDTELRLWERYGISEAVEFLSAHGKSVAWTNRGRVSATLGEYPALTDECGNLNLHVFDPLLSGALGAFRRGEVGDGMEKLRYELDVIRWSVDYPRRQDFLIETVELLELGRNLTHSVPFDAAVRLVGECNGSLHVPQLFGRIMPVSDVVWPPRYIISERREFAIAWSEIEASLTHPPT